MTDYFSHTPANATPGQQVTICYDFDAAGTAGPIPCTADYSPSSVTDGTFSLTKKQPCVTFTIPENATSLIVVDDSGTSEDHAVPFT